jgi:hypothetical protein
MIFRKPRSVCLIQIDPLSVRKASCAFSDVAIFSPYLVGDYMLLDCSVLQILNPSLYPYQASELARRIRDAEKDVKRLVAEGRDNEENGHQAETSEDTENQQQEEYPHDDGSDDGLTDDEGDSDESFDALEDRFHGLEEEVAILVADVHDLALHTKLNITGFMKILKVISLRTFITPCLFLPFFASFVLKKHDVRSNSTMSIALNCIYHIETNRPTPEIYIRSELS